MFCLMKRLNVLNFIGLLNNESWDSIDPEQDYELQDQAQAQDFVNMYGLQISWKQDLGLEYSKPVSELY